MNDFKTFWKMNVSGTRYLPLSCHPNGENMTAV